MGVIGVAYRQSVDFDALSALDPLDDETVFISGKDLMVPDGYTNLIMADYICSVGARAILDSPALRAISRHSIFPVDVSSEPQNNHFIPNYSMNPPQVNPGEALNALTLNTGSNAVDQTVAVWLSDGPVTPITGANMRTVRGTTSFTATADKWSNGQITLDVDLPAGVYSVVGFQAFDDNLVLARLIFPQQGLRPMCIGADSVGDNPDPIFRYGRLGSLGTFQNFVPPKLEVLCNSADANPTVLLDVVKVQ